MASRFLSDEDVRTLTGYAIARKQVEWLRMNGVPFFLNGRGRAVVSASVIEGGSQKEAHQPPTGWTPSVLQGSRR